MNEIEFEDLKELKHYKDIDNLNEFSVYYRDYKRSQSAKNDLNRVLETNYKHVFVAGYIATTNDSIDWDSADIICITDKGNVIGMSNSEWAGFEKV